MTLYIVATPIGNLEDITLRALRILKEVDIIAAEDTRQTKKLLDHYGITTKHIISFHEHSTEKAFHAMREFLLSGKNVAYVVDAGTPGISDPGARLVQEISKFRYIDISGIPGPTALAALFSVAGISANRFLFLGFLPKKKGRAKIFQEIEKSSYPIVFYESPYRIIPTLQELRKKGNFYCVVGRELTKKFETIYRGNVGEVLEQLRKDRVKGEFTIIIQKSKVKS